MSVQRMAWVYATTGMYQLMRVRVRVLTTELRSLPYLLLMAFYFFLPQPLHAQPDDPTHSSFHHEALVVDLHVDPLLWNEALWQERKVRRRAGMVDEPKMRRGGLDVAVLGLVSQGLPLIGGWKPFTWWRGYPAVARRSPWASLEYQVEQVKTWVHHPGAKVQLVYSAAELDQARARGQAALMLGVEGLRGLEGRLERIQQLKQWGVLYAGLVHLSANRLGGSSFPLAGTGGLTPWGKQVIQALEAEGIWIDLAHLSRQAFWETLALSRGPVICSHTGVAGVTPHWRNLDDLQLRAIAERGGLVGILAAPQYLGGRGLERVVAHMLHAVRVMGAEHVALGSDLDGFVVAPRELPDISQLPRLTQALLEAGLTPAQVKGILGGNFERLLRQTRP